MKLNDVINLDDSGFYEFGKGWIPLVRKMAIEIKDCLEKNYPDAIEEFTFTQIKEKFGTLRAYFYPYFDELDNIIDKYEKISARTCEVCGKPGTLKSDGYWMMTRCEEHSPVGENFLI
jgi:CRISPR/Cas system-associated protein Cas10 (large subunit of type III CRISPR-Cas system)